MQLQERSGAVEARGISVVALAQEDQDLESHGQFFGERQTELPFEIVADLKREVTTDYDRVSAYLIDETGIVRQVFPMIIHARPSWDAILAEADRLFE